MKQVRPVRGWPLTPSETAILVIDVQESEASPPALAGQPEFAAAVGRMLPALLRLVEGARGHGCDIVYTVIEALTRDGRGPADAGVCGHRRPRHRHRPAPAPTIGVCTLR